MTLNLNFADALPGSAFIGVGTALIQRETMSPGLKLPNQHAGLASSELNAFAIRTRHPKDLLPISTCGLQAMAVNNHRKQQWRR